MVGQRKVGPEDARSWLLVNGARTGLFDPAVESRADQVVLDIEDAVDPAHNAEARAGVINEVISPTPSDVGWARDFLADFEARGRVIRDGSDKPRLGRALKIEAAGADLRRRAA